MQGDKDSGFVFHEGERRAQTIAQVSERLAELGPRVIRDYMPEQHREFFSLLPWLVIGSVDAHGQPWASAIAGNPGFVTSPDAMHLSVRARPAASDPLHDNLHSGARLGLLGLQSHTRRRNRANGIVTQLDDNGFCVRILQSFGNCPKYIQAREANFAGVGAMQYPATRSAQLDDGAKNLIGRADTFFIATAHPAAGWHDALPAQGVDVSHRGGAAGFVRVVGNALLIPDYVGNYFFNTVGNLLLEKRAGLLFIDYLSNDLLQVAGIVDILWQGDLLDEFPGAQRLLRVDISDVIRQPGALALHWSEAATAP